MPWAANLAPSSTASAWTPGRVPTLDPQKTHTRCSVRTAGEGTGEVQPAREGFCASADALFGGVRERELACVFVMAQHSMKERLEDLERRKQEALHAGPERSVQRQHEMGKLLARERIDELLDPGSF